MIASRFRTILLLGLAAATGLYLLLPLGASYLLTQGLHRYGYSNVIVQLGYPGLRGMRIPVVSFQQDLGGERLLVSLTDVEVRYRVTQLVQGRVGRVTLPYVAVQILNVPRSGSGEEGGGTGDQTETDDSPWTLLTAGDLLRSLPILPLDEFRLDRVTIFREQATGPLRKVTIAGTVRYREGEIEGYLSFQGHDTASYGLSVKGQSASTWSATLVSQRAQASPIVSWQSEAHHEGAQIQGNGQLEVNVRELAPFIALLVPIGPEVGKVTGHVAIHWAGTAPAEATLTSLWRDSRAHLEGNVQVNIILPALRGVAKDIAVAYEGTFRGNAMQVEWTLAPGVLLSATVNAQPRILPIPEAVRKLLPRGDQPFRIENQKPVQGTLYWAETPVRMIAEGPLHMTYGFPQGLLVAEFETSHAEGVGRELVLAEGTYHVEGMLPKGLAELLSAREAMGEFRGTATLARTHVQGVLFPSSFVTAKQVEQGAAVVSSVTLHLAEALPLQCELATAHCSAGPVTAAIRVPAMRIMGRDVRVTQGTLRVQQAEKIGTSWNVQGALEMDGVVLDLAPWGVPATDWKVKFVVNQAGISAGLHVDAPLRKRLVDAKIEQPLSAVQGRLHATIGPVVFDGAERRLSKLLTGLPVSMDLSDGQVTAIADAAWSGGIADSPEGFQVTSGTAKVVAEKLSGQYQDYVVKGLSTTMELRARGLESIATTQPATVTIASVQTGIEAANLSTMFQGTWKLADRLPVFEVKDFRCEVFGGAVSSPGLVVDPAKPPYQAVVSLQRLDLTKILSVEQQQGIQGTGTLNGTLPVTITPGGVTVKDGMVEAQPPGGIIRYGSTPESSRLISETDSQLHLVTQALNNFHYTLLRVGVDYAESGTLFLSARLEGRNPDLKKIPPIHFNLTVQEHIPTLLKSLRLVEDIQDAVEKKYKRP
ncbi:MAG: YdbH domain-containing protein [Nitrospiraceae bacterium]